MSVLPFFFNTINDVNCFVSYFLSWDFFKTLDQWEDQVKYFEQKLSLVLLPHQQFEFHLITFFCSTKIWISHLLVSRLLGHHILGLTPHISNLSLQADVSCLRGFTPRRWSWRWQEGGLIAVTVCPRAPVTAGKPGELLLSAEGVTTMRPRAFCAVGSHATLYLSLIFFWHINYVAHVISWLISFARESYTFYMLLKEACRWCKKPRA